VDGEIMRGLGEEGLNWDKEGLEVFTTRLVESVSSCVVAGDVLLTNSLNAIRSAPKRSKDQAVVVLKTLGLVACARAGTLTDNTSVLDGVTYSQRLCSICDEALDGSSPFPGVIDTNAARIFTHAPLESMRVIAPLVLEKQDDLQVKSTYLRSVMRLLRHSKTKGTALSFREGDLANQGFKTGTLIDYAFKSMTSVSRGLRLAAG
jgi:hypothetical protein